MQLSAVVAVLGVLTLGVDGQLNPLGRWGKCKSFVSPTSFKISDMEGVWYLQYRTKNPDNYAHTCQAQYEEKTKYLNSFLYYYSMGIPRNTPILTEYAEVKPGVYRGGVTIDGCAVNIFFNCLYVEKDSFRIIYICTDAENANPCINAVYIATREQVPSQDCLNRALEKAKYCFPESVDFDKVEQSTDKCAPLNAYDCLPNPMEKYHH